MSSRAGTRGGKRTRGAGELLTPTALALVDVVKIASPTWGRKGGWQLGTWAAEPGRQDFRFFLPVVSLVARMSCKPSRCKACHALVTQ